MSTYLEKLEFDPELKKGLVPGLITNIRLTILLVLGIIVLGIFSLVNLPRRINPQIEIPIVFISAFLPGASPQDIETLVTIPLENAIKNVQGIENITANATENVSTIVVEFNSKVDVDKAKTEIQAAVDTVNNLPQDATEPKVVALDFEDVPVVSFFITGEVDDASLIRFASKLKEVIENTPNVSKVVVSGSETAEVNINIRPEVINRYNVSLFEVQQSIRTILNQYPVGVINANGTSLSVAVDTNKTTLEAIRQLPIGRKPELILGEIAEVSLKAAPNQPKSWYASNNVPPRRAVTFSVFKTLDAPLEATAKNIKTAARDAIEENGNRYQMEVVLDFERDIQNQFNGLIEDFSTSIVLVFITLLLFLGIRQASIASFVIPLSFFATFGAMLAFDIQLSFLSLFSLLLGLGMIVDDTIVMISAMTDYYRTHKFTPEETGLLVWRDYLIPTLTSNLTNIWSFLPLLIASGIIGEFTKVISIVVIIALIGSTAIALIVTIPFMVLILKPTIPLRVRVLFSVFLLIASVFLLGSIFSGSPVVLAVIAAYLFVLGISWIVRQDLVPYVAKAKNWLVTKIPLLKTQNLAQGFFDAKTAIRWYKSNLLKVLRSKSAKWKVIAAVVIVSLFSYILVPLGFVQNEFFPKTDQEFVYLTVELPVGTPLHKTAEEAERLIEEIRHTEGVKHVVADVGIPLDLNSTTADRQESNSIKFTISLPPLEEQTVNSVAIAETLRDRYENYAFGELAIVELTSGPPSGADVQLQLLGDDLGTLQAKANELKNYLKTVPGVTNVKTSINTGASRLTFIPDYQKMAAAGVGIGELSGLIRSYLSGFPVDTVTLDDPVCREDCPVVIRLGHDRFTAEELGSILIPTPQGNQPLLSLGEFILTPNPTQIARQNGEPAISVSGSVLVGYNRIEIGQNMQKYAEANLNLPEGYRWETGGVNEENTRSVNSILQAMVIAALLILATMVLELRSFRKAIIVMLVIPLAISGVFIMFALTGTPLSFPALIGVLALFGIVVKNSIMIVDKINRNLDVGLPFREAVADGASSRLEPIIFSSVTNIIGLLPITISDPLWRGLGGAIISGLTLSGLIMLLFIPVLYDVWYEPKKALSTGSAR